MQRNLLVALCHALAQEQVGAVLSSAVESLVQLLGMRAALAYRVVSGALELVAEQGVPRRVMPWIKRLDADEAEPWFVAQRAAKTLHVEIDEGLAQARAGVGIAPVLREAGWGVVVAAPLRVARRLEGVLVLAAASPAELDRDTLRAVEAVAGLLAIALSREQLAERERDRLEERDSLQLVALGLMAASVRDDLKGPLSTMGVRLDRQGELIRTLRERVGSSQDSPGDVLPLLDELAELTFELHQVARRMQDTTHRLKARREGTTSRTLDLSRVTRESVAWMRSHFDAQEIGLTLVGDEVALPVEGREDELRMLVTQLLFDAARQVRAGVEEERQVVVSLDSDSVRFALTVQLVGAEDRSAAAALYDALVTRERPTSAGRHIGLAIAREIMLAHRGHLELGDSASDELAESGRVTLVRAVFPPSPESLSPEDDRESLPTPTLRPAKTTSPVVLWVDDDDVWTSSLRRFLTTHEVRVATSVAEARAELANLTEPPDAVFCSVDLPDGTGVDLHRAAAQRVAERFVFLCAGVLPAHVAAYLQTSGCPTVSKPITLEEVAAILAREDADDSGRSSVLPTLSPPSSE